jgi:hypothetical protein
LSAIAKALVLHGVGLDEGAEPPAQVVKRKGLMVTVFLIGKI